MVEQLRLGCGKVPNVEWTSVVAALIGGLVGISGSLGGTLPVNRQHRLTRWDDERALVVGELVEIAARSEGSNFRRGRSRHREEPAELQGLRRQRCEDDLDTLLAKTLRLRAIVPALSPEIDAVLDTDGAVRRRTDEGLTGEPEEGWLEIRDAHRSAVAELARRASEILATQ